MILEEYIQENLKTREAKNLHQTLKTIGLWSLPDSEDHQTLNTITLWKTKDSKGPRITSDFVFFWSCLYQTQIVKFIFFWSCPETNKELQGQKEWLDNSSCSKGISNVPSMTLSILDNIPTSLIWRFSTTLNALAPFQRLLNPCLYKELKT